jgi:branched-chain amino acid transport system ATP-binding protein
MPEAPYRELAPGAAPRIDTGPALAIQGLHAWYGESHILHGIDLEVRPGELSRCSAATASARPRR